LPWCPLFYREREAVDSESEEKNELADNMGVYGDLKVRTGIDADGVLTVAK